VPAPARWFAIHFIAIQRKEKTVHAALTKQRIHAIVGQVIDELEHRRATGKADCVKALADEVQRGGIAAWKALRDLLPPDDNVLGGSPSISFGQLFIAAHKEINRLEQTKTVPPVIDVTAEPILALAKLTDTRDGAGGGQPSDRLGKTNHTANVSHSGASTSPARVQSETAQDGDHVEW
jgi:hypothetical protein